MSDYRVYTSIKEVYGVVNDMAKRIQEKFGDILKNDITDTWILGYSIKEENQSKEMKIAVYNYLMEISRDSTYGLANALPRKMYEDEDGICIEEQWITKKVNTGFCSVSVDFNAYTYGSFVYTEECGLSCVVSQFEVFIEETVAGDSPAEGALFFGFQMPDIGFPGEILDKPGGTKGLGSIPEDRLYKYDEEQDYSFEDIGSVGFDCAYDKERKDYCSCDGMCREPDWKIVQAYKYLNK